MGSDWIVLCCVCLIIHLFSGFFLSIHGLTALFPVLEGQLQCQPNLERLRDLLLPGWPWMSYWMSLVSLFIKMGLIIGPRRRVGKRERKEGIKQGKSFKNVWAWREEAVHITHDAWGLRARDGAVIKTGVALPSWHLQSSQRNRQNISKQTKICN